MKSQSTLKKYLLITGMVLSSSVAFAQLTGKISDKKTGETLIGAFVKVNGTNKGTVTNSDGIYHINGLTAGKYSIEVSYINYIKKIVDNIIITSSNTTTIDVSIEESHTNTLQQVTIKGIQRSGSVNTLYNTQKNNIQISSGITSDQIKRSPDKNTSEVLKRVSGASIQDGKFIVVRGLADRYNATMLNNSPLTSTEPDKRAFSFDIIPSNMIDKIVINKTASPDLPGDFSGGVTQLITKDIPDYNFIELAATTGYNTQSTFENFNTNARGTTDFLGFDDGRRNLPSQFPSKRADYNSGALNTRLGSSKLLANNYAETQHKALPMQGYQFNWGSQSKFSNSGKLGSMVSINYRNEQIKRQAQREAFDGINFINKYEDANYRYHVTLGGIANVAYQIKNQKITLKNLFNQTFDNSYIDRSGFINQNTDIKYTSSEINQKTLLNTQLDGSHELGSKEIKINWNLGYTHISRKQPDLRTLMYGSLQHSGAAFAMIDDYTKRFFSSLNENSYNGSASIKIPFELLQNENTIKLGALKQHRNRTFDARIFLYAIANDSEFDNTKLTLSKEYIFDASNISRDGFVLDEITNNQDSYTGSTDLNAGYLMLDNKLTPRIRLAWGARIEGYNQSLQSLNSIGRPQNHTKYFLDLLPSANFTYQLSSKSNFRISASNTVSRPELRELAPFVFVNQEEGVQIAGNPLLVRSQNTNFDLRYELYPTAGEAFTLSLFYKNFKNPIEQVTDGTSTADNLKFSFQNANRAFVYGAEIDVRKKLSFLSDANWLRSLTGYANLTYLSSEVSSTIPGFKTRQLQGLSPFLLNAGIEYRNQNGLSINALYNRVGDRISKVGNESVPHLYEKGKNIIDLQIAKKVLKNKAEIKLSISDLLNQANTTYINFGSGNKQFNRKDDVIYYSFKNGTNISLGFSYSINLERKNN